MAQAGTGAASHADPDGVYELTKEFRFDAAHTLQRDIDAARSRRIHGHSYRAQVTLRGTPDPRSGMILDIARFALALARVREALDHQFLDEVRGLGPGTMENLCAYIWRALEDDLPGLHTVAVIRDSAGEQVTRRARP